ncbi:MAG: hypothetical protein EAZ97_02410 [Bacteroidetes bacterium]|nr:MAG: hypothetical protein EAZ97_02410 [Bacteroidota bacterium]
MTYINPKDDSKHQAAKNPYTVFEVLSKSTQRFDLTEKLANYKKIASLEQIVFAKKNEIYVLIYEKVGDHWLDTVYTNPNDCRFVRKCRF